jgi:hypothetical protein
MGCRRRSQTAVFRIEVGVLLRTGARAVARPSGAVLCDGQRSSVGAVLEFAPLDQDGPDVDHQCSDTDEHHHHEGNPHEHGACIGVVAHPGSGRHRPHRMLAVASRVFEPRLTNGIENVKTVLVVTEA